MEYVLYFGPPLLLLIVVIWVFRRGSRKRYERDARIPFREEDGEDTDSKT